MKKRTRKIMACILVAVMIFGIVPSAKVRADNPIVFQLIFDDLSVPKVYDQGFIDIYGSVFYSFDTGEEKQWTAIDQNKSGIASSEAVANGECRAYEISPTDPTVTTMYYKVVWTNGATLSINGGGDGQITTGSYVGTAAQGGENVHLQFQTQQGGQGGGQGGGGQNPAPDYYEDGKIYVQDINGAVVDYDDSFKSEYGKIQYSTDGTTWNELSGLSSENTEGRTYYTLPSISGTQKLLFRTISVKQYTTSLSTNSATQEYERESRGYLKADGTLISEANVNDAKRDELLADGAEYVRYFEYGQQLQGDEWTSLDATVGYRIQFNPHNILWYTDAQTATNQGANDALVTGGKVEFVSCLMPDGQPGLIEGGQQSGPIMNGSRVVGGAYAAKEGAILTLRLIPDYGYQFKEAQINGNAVTPEAGNYTFKFKFPQGTFHFNCTFVPGQDKATGSATGVASAAKVNGTVGDASINGNLALQAKNANVSSTMKSNMEAVTGTGSDVIPGAYVDLSIQSYAEKAASRECWYVPMSETQKDVSVTLAVSDAVAQKIQIANGVCYVVRAHANAQGKVEYTKIPATYNASKKTITFASKQFSTFAIAAATTIAAPSSATATLIGHNDVKVSWKKVSGTTGYKVYYKKGSGKYVYYKSTTSTSMKLMNLSDGQKYTFKVASYKTVQARQYLGGARTTSPIVTLKKVSGIAVKKGGSRMVKVQWKKIDGASGYQIARSVYKTKKFAVLKNTNAKTSSYKKSTVRKKTYYYKVRAYKVVAGKKIYGPWSSTKKYSLR